MLAEEALEEAAAMVEQKAEVDMHENVALATLSLPK